VGSEAFSDERDAGGDEAERVCGEPEGGAKEFAGARRASKSEDFRIHLLDYFVHPLSSDNEQVSPFEARSKVKEVLIEASL